MTAPALAPDDREPPRARVSGEASVPEPQPVSELPGMVRSMEPPIVDTPASAANPPAPKRAKLGIDFEHPLVRLGILGCAVAGMFAFALHLQPPTAPAAAAAEPPSGSSVAAAPPAASTSAPPPAHADDGDGVDTDPDDAPPAHAHGSTKKKATRSHAPDAKAGDAVGYRNGEPMHIVLTIVDGKPVEVHTAVAFKKMKAAAARAAVTLAINSGFRTMERQKELYADYRAGRGHLAALPGHSNHQSGHALDLFVTDPKVRAWLEAHAGEFGFQRTIPSEAWHWEQW